MSAVLRNMMVVISASTNQFVSGMNQVAKEITATERRFKSFEVVGKHIQSLGKSLTIGLTLPLVLVGKSMVNAAAQAEETENLFRISMGGMADAAAGWADSLSKSLGLNRYNLMGNVGMLNQMFSSMEMGTKTSYDMATGLTQLAYDMASFYNLSPDEAFDKLRSGIMGQGKPLRDLGVLVDDATVKAYAYTHGIAQQGEALTAQEKVLARYGSIMEQTKNAQGDLERTSGSLTNQLRALKERTGEIAVEFGKILAPMVTGLVEKVRQLVDWFSGLDEGKKRLIVTVGLVVAAMGPLLFITGGLISNVKEISGTVKGLGKVFEWLSAPKISPLGLTLIAIGALVALGIMLIQHWDEVKKVATYVWEGIYAVIKPVLNIIKHIVEWTEKAIDALLRFLGIDTGARGESPSVSIPTITEPVGMQHGAIVRRPTLALIGEATAEAVTPLSWLSDQFERAAVRIAETMSGIGGPVPALAGAPGRATGIGTNVTLTIYQTIGDRATADYATNELLVALRNLGVPTP